MYTLTLYYTSGPLAEHRAHLDTFRPAQIGARGHCPNGGEYVVIGRKCLDRRLTRGNRSVPTV